LTIGLQANSGQRQKMQSVLFHTRDEHLPCMAAPSAFHWLIDGLWQKFQSKPVTFQYINQRGIKAFAAGQHCGHKFRRVIELEPCGLERLDVPACF
jgi:hypothetical protein